MVSEGVQQGYLGLQCLWIAALSFQYGLNISALNGLLFAVRCWSPGHEPGDGFLPACFPVTVIAVEVNHTHRHVDIVRSRDTTGDFSIRYILSEAC